jgi:hypothetical protein
VGSIERDTFAVYGIEISRSTEGSYRVDQNVKKNTLDLYPYVLLKDRQDHEPANDREVRFIMSTVGSLLFIGRVTCPPLLYIASHFGSRLSRLQVRHVKELNALLKKTHRMNFVLAFEKPPTEVEVAILGYSDASYYRTIERHEDSRLGIVVFRTWGTQKGVVAHAIDFSAHKLRRVATSTKAAETQAALESLGKMRFLNKLGQEMGCTKAALIEVTDSTTLKAGIVGTTRQLDGTVQVDILALRQGFANGELCIAWCRSQEQLADPCTKAKADVVPLMTTLNTGRLFHSVGEVLVDHSTL